MRTRDQFDDAEAEADAGGGAGQTLIDAVEAAEDPAMLARRDPDAVVLHVKRDALRARGVTRTTIRLSSGVYFIALSSRLMSAETTAPSSARTGGRSGATSIRQVAVGRHPLADGRRRRR